MIGCMILVTECHARQQNCWVTRDAVSINYMNGSPLPSVLTKILVTLSFQDNMTSDKCWHQQFPLYHSSGWSQNSLGTVGAPLRASIIYIDDLLISVLIDAVSLQDAIPFHVHPFSAFTYQDASLQNPSHTIKGVWMLRLQQSLRKWLRQQCTYLWSCFCCIAQRYKVHFQWDLNQQVLLK